jgi:hypothetical protein
MKLLQKAEIEGVDLVFLPFALLRDSFGDTADATLLLHDRRRRLALLDLRPPSNSSLSMRDSDPALPKASAADVYDESTIDDEDTDLDSHAKSNKSSLAATNTTTTTTTTTATTTSSSAPMRKKSSTGLSDSAAKAASKQAKQMYNVVDDDDRDDDSSARASTSDADSSLPRASRRTTEDLTPAVSSDGGDTTSITSLTPPNRSTQDRGAAAADDDDDWHSSPSSSSRRGRYRPRNGPREPLADSPPASPRMSSSSARSLMARTATDNVAVVDGTASGNKHAALMRSASDSMASGKNVAAPPPAIASLDRRKQHKLQQLLGDEVALANHSTSSATELAIQHVIETVTGAAKLQLRQPWRTFLVSDDLTELEAPRDGNAQEKTPIAKLKVLRTAHYVLFSDLLLRCWQTPVANKYQLHDAISLDSVLLVDLDASGDNKTFQIVVMGGRKGSEKLTLRTRTPDEKREWLHYLNGIIDRKLVAQLRSYKTVVNTTTNDDDDNDNDKSSPRHAAKLLGLPQQPESAGEVRRVSVRRRRRAAENASAATTSSAATTVPAIDSVPATSSSAPHSPRSPRSPRGSRSPRSPRSRSPRSRSPSSPRLRSSRSKSPRRREGAISALLRPLRRGRSSSAEFSLRVSPVDANEVPTARRECTVCRSWLSGNLLVVNGYYYHHDCLLCSSCHIGISPGTCYLDPSTAASPAPSVLPLDASRVPSLLCTGCFTRLVKRSRRATERDRGWMLKATSPGSLSNAILQQTTGGTPVGDVVAARRHAKLQRMLDDNQPAVRRRNASQTADAYDDDNGIELDTEDLVDLDALPGPDDTTDSDLSSSDEPTTSTNSRSSSTTRRLRTTRLPSQTIVMALGEESDDEESTANTPTLSHASRGSRG